jgi:hypothetical protein
VFKLGKVNTLKDKKLWEKIIAPWEDCSYNERGWCRREREARRFKVLKWKCHGKDCPHLWEEEGVYPD